jgi:hypothetical protein
MVGQSLPVPATSSLKLMNSILKNVISFQIGWFACVLGAAYALPWLGPLLVLAIISLHLRQTDHWQRELPLILIIGICGSVFDQFLLSLGWIQYLPHAWPTWLLPLWMLCLWLLFATTLNVSLRWMRSKHLLAMIFGLLGGPLAYLAGQRLGAMQLLAQTNILIVLAVFWGLMMPAMLRLATTFDGFARKTDNPDITGIQHV